MDEQTINSDLQRRLAEAEAALSRQADIEAALQQSEQLRRIAIEGGRMGTWRWDLRDEFIWGDAAFLSLWGYPPSDEPRRLPDFTDRMSSQGQAEMDEMVTRALEAGEVFDGQLAVVNGPTAGRWVRWRGCAERERPWIVNGVSFDVTDQRARDERLRESDARHRLLVDSWAQALWETDAQGVVTVDSPSWRACTGQSLEEWFGYGWLNATHPDDRAYAERQWREAIEVRGLVDAQLRLRRLGGGWRWTNVRAAPVLNAAGGIEKWAGMNIDIHARKHAEEALRDSERRFRALATTGAFSVYRMSPDWRLMYELDGGSLATTADPIADWVEKYIPDDDLPAVRDAISHAIRSKSMFELEHRVRLADGGTGWVLSRAVPLLDDQGEIVEWFGAGSDITARKRAEEALAASEQRLSLATAASELGVWEWDLVNDRPVGNAFYYQHFDLEPFAEHRGVDVIAKLHPDDIPMMLATHAAAMEPASDGHYTVEYRVMREGAGPRWLYSSGQVFFKGEGAERRPERSLGTSLDITEQKLAEAALRQSEEGQAFLLKLSDALRPLVDPADIEDAATRVLGEHLRANRVAYVEVTDEEYIVERDYVNGVPSMAGRYLVRSFGSGKVVDYSEGKTVIVNNVASNLHDDASAAASFAAINIAAGIGVPLMKQGRFVANLVVHASEPRDWTSQEVRIVEETAERTWAAVERARAETKLRESEERLRQFGDASQDILWIRDGATLQWTYLTPAFETVYGLRRDDALSGDNYRNWQDLIVPEDRAQAVAAVERVLAGEQVTFEYRVQRPSDGAIRWLRNTDFPISDETGKVVAIGGVGHDMTDLKAVQAAIAGSEGRLRTLMEGIPQLVWRSCAEGHWTWASPQWLDFTGQHQQETHGLGWLGAVHPDDHEATLLAWEEARPHGLLDVEYRVRRGADGAWLWHHTRSVPVRDGEGGIVEWLGTSTDVHALRELQERQGVLVAELQHRTRNLITVVRSLSDRTIGNAASLDDFKGRFGRRLAALSRVQGLLSHLSAGERVDFDELLRTELAALGVMDGKAERVTLDGPSAVPLRSATVQTLALAVHELATNAVKYGALSAAAAPNAHLTVHWHVDRAAADEPPLLHVDWLETGVEMPQVSAPARGRGYGRELIERALPYQLGADTTYELGGDGVRCTIEMSISRESGDTE